MAEDLRHFLAEPEAAPDDSTTAVKHEEQSTNPSCKIVPKGLRSFDAGDADFFLELLPGLRDRDGLPESVRFWKTRIEETDSDETFRVGLIYGPSGCGKSSLVKAGLIPRLADRIIPVYVEATAGETESRLLRGIRKQRTWQGLPAAVQRTSSPWQRHSAQELRLVAPATNQPAAATGLTKTLAALRRGDGLSDGKKVLIVLDQFEQWLHAREHDSENTELIQALRQCDGEHVQCVVMVRDDFWMAATRFFRDLDIRLSEGENSAAVDLFDVLHARTVLAKFGRAFGRLPQDLSQVTGDQGAFLDHAVLGLARDGKIVCVRLSVFAEMVKGKLWEPTTLKAVGGIEGVGETFLEETFGAAAAPPEHRLHQKAARAVLKALLPDSGTDIKGSMRPFEELLEASGYAERLLDFDQLIDILDSRIRLITPTDPADIGADEHDVAGASSRSPSTENSVAGASSRSPTTENSVARASGPNTAAEIPSDDKYYQLTHDYLVPSLCAWLTKKQKETRRGRAELRLAERAAAWNAKPEKRHLPVWWEFVGIEAFTDKKTWTSPQREFMRQAVRNWLKRGAVWLVLFVGIVSAGVVIRTRLETRRKADHVQALVQRLIDAEITNTRDIITELREYREWSNRLLETENRQAPEGSTRRLHTALALLPDQDQVEYLAQQMLLVEPQEFMVIRSALGMGAGRHVDHRWQLTLDERCDSKQRFRAACALAQYSPADARWQQVERFVAEYLVSVLPSQLEEWADALHSAKHQLIGPLMTIFQDTNRNDQERLFAAIALIDYSSDVGFLFELLKDANDRQCDAVFAALKPHGKRSLDLARRIVSSSPETNEDANEKERNARMRAHAGMVVLKMGEPETDWGLVAPLLEHSPEPLARSYLINSIDLPAVHASAIAKRLDTERNQSIRRGLVLVLRNIDITGLAEEERKTLTEKLLVIYREEPDPGLHGALDWAMREWGKAEELAVIDNELATGRLEGDRKWYVNRESQTMMVITGPQEVTMESLPTKDSRTTNEPIYTRTIKTRRTGNEPLHRMRIGRSFAIASKEVTVAQCARFLDANPFVGHSYKTPNSPEPTCPQTSVIWYEAVHYCNWLSQQDGLSKDQWCYLPNKNSGEFPGERATTFSKTMEFAPNYLSLSGYRLPTEAEFECACRAGTLTKRFYGNSDELLSAYAWYQRNSQLRSWPVGLLLPNDCGLFDMQGNVVEWCQTVGQEMPSSVKNGVAEDVEHVDLVVKPGITRALKGGSFIDLEMGVRSGQRGGFYPNGRRLTIGFRPARTIPK